jgi:hypothetical protein
MLIGSFKLIIKTIPLLRCLFLEIKRNAVSYTIFGDCVCQRCLDPLAACSEVMTVVANVRIAFLCSLPTYITV